MFDELSNKQIEAKKQNIKEYIDKRVCDSYIIFLFICFRWS